MVERLKERFPFEDLQDWGDGSRLYKRLIEGEGAEGGIAVSSGCIACNNGNDCRSSVYTEIEYEVSED